MTDPLATLLALSLALSTAPDPNASLDPGPSPECPSDMRLVAGQHRDEVQNLCIKPHQTDNARGGKDTKCFAYWEGLTALEGPTTEIRVCMDQYEAPNKKGASPLRDEVVQEREEVLRGAAQAAVHRAGVGDGVRGSGPPAVRVRLGGRSKDLQQRQEVAGAGLGQVRR